MNDVITKLADAGCDIGKGLETNYNEEELYISSLRSFAEDDTPQKMEKAIRSNDLKQCRMYACSFRRVLYNLGMRELYYLNDSIFASAECGAMYRYHVRSFTYTTHMIDSVKMTDSLITNNDAEQIQIFFRTAEEEGGER